MAKVPGKYERQVQRQTPSGVEMGPRPIKAPGAGVFRWDLRRGIASLLGSMPQYFSLKYMPVRLV
jgi:hypothetical protein